MKIIIFDVGNASCNLLVDDEGRGMMIDCGLKGIDKTCPVELIDLWTKEGMYLSNMSNGLDLLAITHPDDDHINNSEKVRNVLYPTLLQRRRLSEFPHEEVHSDSSSYLYYKNNICEYYNGPTGNAEFSFSRKKYEIPINEISALGGSFKNNSSYVYVVEYGEYRVLFGGDMETIGWQRLILNNLKFAQEVLMGFDFYIASHHGHKSGYHPNLLNKERIKTVFISKASEVSIDGTDVFPYSEIASGYTIESIKTGNKGTVKMASTRNHGNIFINLKMGTIHSHKGI